MDAASIMTRDVVTAKPTDSVRSAIRKLEDQDVRHLPVIDGDRLAGVVSDRDLREYRLPLYDEMDDPEYASNLLVTPLSEVLKGSAVCVDTGDDLREVIDAMVEYGIGAVPVVDRHTEELVGIVSYVDILKAIRPSL